MACDFATNYETLDFTTIAKNSNNIHVEYIMRQADNFFKVESCPVKSSETVHITVKTPKWSQHYNQMQPGGLSLGDHQSLVCDNRFERLLTCVRSDKRHGLCMCFH